MANRHFIEDPSTGRIRFTPCGIKELGPKFAKVGIDIRTLKTKHQARLAAEQYSDYVLRDLALNSANPEIDAIFADVPAYADGLALKRGT